MIKNYFKIAWRTIKSRRFYSVVNILGLSAGMVFTLLIAAFIRDEWAVNRSLRNAGNHYLVRSNWKVKNMGLDITTIAPLAKAMKEEYPGLVANYYRYNPVVNVVSAGNNYYKENIAIGDTSFISMYGFTLVQGNPQQPFRDDNSAVITESMAKKLFGKTDALNQRISVQTLVNNEKQDYLVSAVLKDLPRNSVTGLVKDDYTVFVPTTGNRYYAGGDPAVPWTSVYEIAFLELKEGVTAADMQSPFRQVLAKYAPENIRNNLEVELVPVRDYYRNADNGAVQKMITTLALTGGFILLMAVINFINISIGVSPYRLKEIGLRKVLGGNRRQLVFQFLSESVLLALIAGGLSLLGYELLRPVFNQVLDASVSPLRRAGSPELLFFTAFILLLGIVSGLYPAFVLSAARIAHSVKGKMTSATSGALLRKSLLVVQFSLTVIVFIGAISVSRQVSHVFNKDTGYNREQLLVVTAFPKQWDTAGVQRMENIKQQLLQLPVVKAASLTFEIPDRKPPAALPLLPPGEKGNQPLNIPTINVDEDYAAACEIQLVSGSFFNHGAGAFIPGQVVLNEAAVKALGLDSRTAIGQQLRFPPPSGGALTIAGIVKDYNYSNIQEGIEPLAFMHVRDALSYRYLALRLRPGNTSEAIAGIQSKWKEAAPYSPFEYFFMDEKFQSLYTAELKLKKAANVATGLNLLIVLMGVFGVVAFALIRRNREIAIRKVLGADTPGIIRLFLKEYGWAITIANLVGWPVAYFIIDKWLQNYTYRIQQDIFSYLLVGLSVFLVAFLLIAVQCFKAATANPVKSLRTE
ncbi:MAG: ABC transporter permease [Chitinophagaceae bacterium]